MKVVGLQTHIWDNTLKSLLLLALFPMLLFIIIFLVFFSLSLSAQQGISDETLAMTLGLLKNFAMYIVGGVVLWFIVAWLFHQSIILGMTRAQPIDRKDEPRVYNIVENLCIARGVPVPKLYIIEDDSLNAFASGLSPKNALITFSRGIINKLDDDELEAVAAHELTHILNYDIRLMVVAIIFVGIIQTVSEMFLRMRVSPQGRDEKSNATGLIVIIKIFVFVIGFLFTVLVQLAISRKREYLADAGAVELTKKSEPLISALKKISRDSRIEVIENRSVAQLCIENPLSEEDPGILAKLFSTHPPIGERIKALEMVGGTIS